MIFIGCFDENYDDQREIIIVERLLGRIMHYTPNHAETLEEMIADDPLTDKQISFINSYSFHTRQVEQPRGVYNIQISYDDPKIYKQKKF